MLIYKEMRQRRFDGVLCSFARVLGVGNLRSCVLFSYTIVKLSTMKLFKLLNFSRFKLKFIF
jgi:hypothetical protein